MMRLAIHPNRRPAFTLIELLIVLAIIVVLVSLAGVSYYFAAGRQYEKNTNATIEYVHGILKKQWNHVVAEAKKEAITDAVRVLAQPDATGERAKVLMVKLRLAEAFPGSFTEIQTYMNANAGNPYYIYRYLPTNSRKYLPGYHQEWMRQTGGVTAYTMGLAGAALQLQLQRESSSCLVMALSTSKGGVAINKEQLPTPFVDTDNNGAGNGLFEFGDAWRNPIAFFRFPTQPNPPPATQNALLGASMPSLSGPRGAYFDPLDPMMTLADSNWPNQAFFQQFMGYQVGNYFTVPVVASAGADGILDLRFRDPTAPTPVLEPWWDPTLIPAGPPPPPVWPYNDMALLSHEGSPNVQNHNCPKDNIYSFVVVAP